MGLRNPVALAGVVGVGVPVLAAGVVAGLTIKTGETGPHPGSKTSAQVAPSQTPAPAAPAPTLAAEPDPVGFQPDSIDFLSAEEGWVLGRSYPCAGPPCRALRHTTDGGLTWQQVTLPAPLLAHSPTHTGGGRGWTKFADARNGWVGVDGTLFATHDAGKTWRQIVLDGATLTGDLALSVSGDNAYLVAVQAGDKAVVFTAPVDSDSWSETTDIPVSANGGPDASARVTALGTRVWLAVTGRTPAGARLVEGAWMPWKLPCGGNGPADWHAVSERRVLALCGRSGPAQTDTATHVMTSLDGGASFTETGQVSGSVSGAAVLLAADATHLVAAADDQLFTSADGGETWTVTYTAPGTGWQPRAGEFVSETTGFVIMARTGGEHAASIMLSTQDAGRTWTPVTVGS